MKREKAQPLSTRTIDRTTSNFITQRSTYKKESSEVTPVTTNETSEIEIVELNLSESNVMVSDIKGSDVIIESWDPSTKTVSLCWNPIPSARKYVVKYTRDGGFTWFTTVKTSGLQQTLFNVKEQKRYLLKIIGYDVTGKQLEKYHVGTFSMLEPPPSVQTIGHSLVKNPF